jgi:threonine synthase
MGFELAEQLGWRLPDVIVYPTGGGVGLIGMWKAFDELRSIGWIDQKRPRFVSVQAEGCAPIVKAFVEERPESEAWPDPRTFAAGIRVPKALGDFIVLKALRESAGTAVAVTETEIADSMRAAGAAEGMLVCPEGGAALAGTAKLRRDGWIREDDEVVIFNTGTGLKYAEFLQGEDAPHLAANELPDE